MGLSVGLVATALSSNIPTGVLVDQQRSKEGKIDACPPVVGVIFLRPIDLDLLLLAMTL